MTGALINLHWDSVLSLDREARDNFLMTVEITHLNQRIELLEGLYGAERAKELEYLSRLHNRHTGPITSVNLYRPELLDLALYTSSCEHSDIGRLIGDLSVKENTSQVVFVPGGGKGIRMQQAFFGALGELAERFLAILDFEAICDRLEYSSY